MLIMFWQYCAGLPRRVRAERQQRLVDFDPVQVGLGQARGCRRRPAPRVVHRQQGGDRGAFLGAAARSSSAPATGWPGCVRQVGRHERGAAEHGSMNLSTRPLSLPLDSAWVLVMPASLAAVSCAVWPVAGLSRYSLATLSLWSWSIRSKLRTWSGRPARPCRARRSDDLGRGPLGRHAQPPEGHQRVAARKKRGAIAERLWPKGDPRPLTQWPCASALGVAPPGSGSRR